MNALTCSQVSQIVGDVDGVFLKRLEGHYLKRALVSRRQHHRGGAPSLVGPQPVHGGDTPAVAGQQAGKSVFGDRRQ
jgi:hypothetical protein